MAMQIRKLSETATSITLGWDPVPGADGYRFYSAGVLRSKTMDPRRRTVKFSKGQDPYRVDAVVLNAIDSGTYPAASPPPPPPPVTFKKVAPLVAYADGFSNGRFCLYEQDGSLRPGVAKQPDGTYRDDVGHYDQDGLQLGAERSEARQPGLTSAKEIDGRPICSLPTVGDPTKNTGSWAI